jgi:hypothetical protein
MRDEGRNCDMRGILVKLPQLPCPLWKGVGRHGLYTDLTAASERALVSVGEWSLHIAVKNV